jgi:uncharacterized protein (TIGR02265 family)
MLTTVRYAAPALTAPLDLAAHIALAPRHGKVKGMFFRKIIDDVRAATGKTIRNRSYFHFSDYPLSDWLALLYDAAQCAYPHEPVRAGLRRLGRSMYPTFVDSMIGKVVFSVAGNNVTRALPLYPKIWSVVSNHGTAVVDELTEGRVVIRLRNVWDFLDSFQLGSLEGGMGFFGVDARVKVAEISPCDADFEIIWTP